MGVVERTISECSDDIDIRPLELSDLQRKLDDEGQPQAVQRKRGDQMVPSMGLSGSDKFFSVVYGLKKKDPHDPKRSMLARMAWKNAYNKVKALGDPWEKFHIRKFVTEKAKRFRYKALQKKWVEDEVLVKMEEHPFNHGAMRECFRMKKLSNFSHDDWSKAHNYVAKRYMELNTQPKTYYDDVKLQMDAKLWGEEYNRHNPPKKVDIFQMAVLQLYERPGAPLYHVEHFIEGVYTKYNSNSGYVSSKRMRMTPHAFSHFTFERSGHELIVVDIQGVGDLYTDPQIHTAQGEEYGDGNLGTRGMALFFHSHVCNTICKSLGLTQFDMAPSEIQALKKDKPKQTCPKTIVRGTEELVVVPNEEQRSDLHEYLRQRSMSSGCVTQEDECYIAGLNIGSFDSMDSVDDLDSEDSAIASARKQHHLREKARGQRVRRTGRYSIDGGVVLAPPEPSSPNGRRGSESSASAKNSSVRDTVGGLLSPQGARMAPRRQRLDSSSSETDSVSRLDLVNRNEMEDFSTTTSLTFSAMVSRRSRPSNIVSPEQHQDIIRALDGPRPSSVNTILGQVHLDVAKYYELNRFNSQEEGGEGSGASYDKDAAVFHVRQAAHCGVLEGLLAAAQLLLGLPHYILPDVELPEEQRDQRLGFRFIEEACRAGDRWAVVTVATALHQGVGLPEGRSLDWSVAYALYERAISGCDVDDEGGYDALMDVPPYQLKARQAEMLLKGQYGLAKDPNRAGELYSEAAELATEAMKGKLAGKYYMEAENAWMECEEE